MARMLRWLLVGAGLVLAACNSGKSTGPSVGPTGAFHGTLVGANVSGVLTLTFPSGTAVGPARRTRFSLIRAANAAAAPISITGTLAVTGASTIPLNGTYDPSANPQLTVTGGGYTITGHYNGSTSQFSGSFSGPGSSSGQWTVSAGGSTVKVFCGTYINGANGGSGTLNVVLDASNRLSGVVTTPIGPFQLQGSYTPGSNPNLSLTFAGGAGSVNGNLDPASGAAGGGWSDNSIGAGGSWWASTSLCTPPPPGADLFAVWAQDLNNVYAVGDAGTILYYNGTSWNLRASGTTNTLYAIGPGLFVVGAGGTILQYNPTTLAWSPQTSGTTNALYGVAKAPAKTFFAVGAAGTILHYDGSSWSLQTSNTTSTLYSVAKVSMVAADFAAGAGGTILYYDGTSWSSQTSNTTNDLYFVGAVSGTNAYAIGATGTALHYNGTTWSALATGGLTVALRSADAAITATTLDLFVVGDAGTILHSSDGVTFSPQMSGTTNNLFGVSVNTASDVFAVGVGGRILHYNGTAWTKQR